MNLYALQLIYCNWVANQTTHLILIKITILNYDIISTSHFFFDVISTNGTKTLIIKFWNTYKKISWRIIRESTWHVFIFRVVKYVLIIFFCFISCSWNYVLKSVVGFSYLRTLNQQNKKETFFKKIYQKL